MAGRAAVIGGVGAIFRTSQTTEFFVSRAFDRTLVTGTVGYRDDLNTTVYSTEVRRTINCCWAAFAEITYEEDGLWASAAGLEYRFGPSAGYGCPSYGGHRDGGAVETASYQERDVVRGQILDGGPFGGILDALFGDGITGGDSPWNSTTFGGAFNYDASDFWERVPFAIILPPGMMMMDPPFRETGNGEGDDCPPEQECLE